MSISSTRRRAILAAHGGVCYYCAAPDATHVDHIVPRAGGGSDDLGNLIAACLPCNLRKMRHRLPPAAEQRAMAAAAAAREEVEQIQRSLYKAPARKQAGDYGNFSPAYCRGGRAMLEWSKQDLAAKSGISVNSIGRFEAGLWIKASTATTIRVAMEQAGMEFFADRIRCRAA